MPYARQRKYPRIPFNRAGTLEFHDSRRGRLKIPATITSVACEGIGLTMHQPMSLRRRARVSVSLSIQDNELTLPGVVAWQQENGVGIHLLLELALPATRQRWAHWIVDQTSQFRIRQRRRSTS